MKGGVRMNIEDLTIEVLFLRYKAKGYVTEEEISDLCEEKNVSVFRTSYIIEKLMSRGAKITNNRGSAGPRTNRQIKNSKVDEEANYKTSHYSGISNNKDVHKNVIEKELKSKTDGKYEIVDFNSDKSYSDKTVVYAKYKSQVFETNDWIEAYVNIMSALAESYHTKLASWSGMGDVFKDSDLKKASSDKILKQINTYLYVNVSYSTDELIKKISKYVAVCNVSINDVVIAITDKLENIENNCNSNPDIEISTINATENTVCDEIQIAAETDSSNKKIIVTDMKNDDEHGAESIETLKNEDIITEEPDNDIALVLNDVVSALESKLDYFKHQIVSSIELEDHNKAVQIYSSAHENICILRQVNSVVNDVIIKIKEFQINAEEKISSLQDVIVYFNNLLKYHKSKASYYIENFNDEIVDSLNNTTSSISLMIYLISELNKVSVVVDKITQKQPEQNENTLKAVNIYSDFSNLSLKSAKFLNCEYQVSSFNDLLVIICDALALINKNRFCNLIDRDVSLEGRPYRLISSIDSYNHKYNKLKNLNAFVNVYELKQPSVLSLMKMLINYFELNPNTDLILIAEEIR